MFRVSADPLSTYVLFNGALWGRRLKYTNHDRPLLADSGAGCAGVLLLVLARLEPFLAVVCFADHRRGCFVCAPRTVFCAYSGNSSVHVFGGAIGLINACGALGAFIGSWIAGYLIGLTGNPGAAYIFMTVGVLSSALLMAWVKVRQ